jgi:5-methylcytosine-specific restriction endonuclease McrA
MAANPLGTRRYQAFAERVRRRDRETCQICGAWGRTVDHIMPRHLGGALRDMSNARVLCKLCNLIKGGSMMRDADVLAARRARGDERPGRGTSYGGGRNPFAPRPTIFARPRIF